MAERTPLQLSAAELASQLDALLREWLLHASATPVATDQRLQIRARLRQLQQQDASAPLNVAAVLGPLLCKSPQALNAFRDFCSTDADRSKTARHIPPTATAATSTRTTVDTPPTPDIKMLQRKLWLLASALVISGALVVTVWAGWAEWRQKLCGWDFWGERFCESVAAPDQITPTPQKTTVTATRDNAAFEPIIEPVTVAVRQPPLTLVRADLDPPGNIVFRNRCWLLVPPVIGLLLGWLYANIKRRALEQRLSKLPTWRQQLNLIDLKHLQPLFVDAADRKTIAAAQYRTGGHERLDIPASVDISVRSQLPTLVKRARRVRSSMVFAIAMQTRSDWRGQYFATLVKELQHSGLQAQLFYYWRSPQELYPERDRSRSAPLYYWRKHYSNSTLVVLADEQTLFHPVFGNELGWLAELHSWSQHLLVFTTALSTVQCEQLQHGGYQLHSGVDATGVTRLLLQLVGDVPEAPMAESESSSCIALPESLAHLGEVQAMTATPDAAELEKLIRWLKYRLGAPAFRLFCASVLFPRPDWRLTRGLAHRLAIAQPGEARWHSTELLMRGSPKLLAPLARLPWCRHGYFPLWLRGALYEQLNTSDKTQVSALLRSFMSRIDEPSIDPLQLTVDMPAASISAWLRWAKRDGPAHDVLFASLLNRGPLAFLLDRWHRHNMHNRVQTALTATAGAMVATLLGTIVWNLAPETATLEDQVARRCGLNQQHILRIEHTQSLQQQTETLQASLQALCYEPELIVVEPSAQSSESVNSLQAAPAHAVLLNRAISYALYQAPLESRQLESGATQSIVSLQIPIQSRQVFRSSFLPNDPLPELNQDKAMAKIPVSSEIAVRATTPSPNLSLPDMQLIPAGTFSMGSENGVSDEQPVHRVTIAAFELARHELTWGEWQQCESAAVCPVLERPNWINEMEAAKRTQHPVVNVSWDEAQIYIGWINTVTDGGYRLPSEAEFEYALRAGAEEEYPWEKAEQCEYSNGLDKAYQRENPGITEGADCGDGFIYTAPVGSFRANAFELYEVSGNTWEWTQDCWNGNYEEAPGDGSAWETGECDWRVWRGGGWDDRPVDLRSANRSWNFRDDGSSIVGFRLARTL